MTNNTQFATLDEAKLIASKLGAIGGGVLPYSAAAELEQMPPDVEDIDRSSGIYIPTYFAGPFPTPQQGERSFYHFRFRNGADGINVGLVKQRIARFPLSWPANIAAEVNAAAKR